ncbi:hypothetical protein SKAU_G00397990 [Synaphobranchus kaupii]|uniref:Uncharacterized protein n=1 Tax=Synaphobranchus kaupii TaxID=118154 RepID=A0A9Q1E8H9_SYNKA|nr:hypothetical protein SKAU_G00397990 [Synaphobranchus kaupii]
MRADSVRAPARWHLVLTHGLSARRTQARWQPVLSSDGQSQFVIGPQLLGLETVNYRTEEPASSRDSTVHLKVAPESRSCAALEVGVLSGVARAEQAQHAYVASGAETGAPPPAAGDQRYRAGEDGSPMRVNARAPQGPPRSSNEAHSPI